MADNEIYKYRWIVVALATLANALTWGITYSVGVFYVRWIDYFDAGKGKVAIIGGINSGTTCLLGPVFGLIVHRFGIRFSGIFSGVLLVFGLISSAFSSSIPLLCVFYGVFAGSGVGLGYYCASLVVNTYFIRHRSIAEGIGTAGCGLGGFAFSAFGQYLIDRYGWQGAILILGAISANIIVIFQLAITPSELEDFPKLRNWKSRPDEDSKDKECTKESLEKVEEAENDDMLQTDDENGTLVLSNDKEEGWFLRCSHLFKNPVFLLILCSDFFCWIAIYVPFMHLPERAKLLGLDMATVAWMASLLSLTSGFSRATIGTIPSFFKVDAFYLYGFINALAGILTILSPLLTTKAGLIAYAALFGAMNVCVPLGRASVAKLLGPGTYPLAYSWIIFFEGVALFAGPPLAGLIYDVTLSYDYSFYATGSMLVISGLLTLFRNAAVRMQRRLHGGVTYG